MWYCRRQDVIPLEDPSDFMFFWHLFYDLSSPSQSMSYNAIKIQAEADDYFITLN